MCSVSQAYCYLGENLLEQEKCGPAIRALEESERHFGLATKLCRDYGQLKMAVKTSMNAKIDEHLFFRNLRPLVGRVKDKCVRENGFIFHQKVPKDCPPLEMKATHGLVTPEDFSMPALHELWTADAYTAFDITRNVNDPKVSRLKISIKLLLLIVCMQKKDGKDSKKAAATSTAKESGSKKDDPPVEEIQEKPINGSKDQKNESGCSIQ